MVAVALQTNHHPHTEVRVPIDRLTGSPLGPVCTLLTHKNSGMESKGGFTYKLLYKVPHKMLCYIYSHFIALVVAYRRLWLFVRPRFCVGMLAFVRPKEGQSDSASAPKTQVMKLKYREA